MHIPDGLMDPLVLAAGWLAAVVFMGLALWRTRIGSDRRMVPFMGLLAAAIFAVQMLNFPIGGGTSGHMVGAVMAGFLLGPWAGMVVISAVLIVQCLMFGDGGITALGLNFVNMAVIGCLIGAYLPRLLPKRWTLAGVFIASWTAVILGSFVCAGELAISHSISGGTYGISGTIAFPAMLAFHAVIGLGEALITTAAVGVLLKAFPEISERSMMILPKAKGGAADA